MTSRDGALPNVVGNGIALPRLSVSTKTLLLHAAILVALPLSLLLLNDSWNSGWVVTPSGSEWVEAGNHRTAPPQGWLTNHTQDYLDTPISWVDPYVYQSFFLDLKGTLNLHQEEYGWKLYYHSRLPWLLLGNAAYSVAGPETGNVLLHLAVFYTAMFALYATVRLATKNDLAALIAACLIGVNTYVLASIGSNYVDGFGMAMLLLTLVLFTKAAVSDSWRLPLILGGIAAVTAVSVNVFLVAVVPATAVWYLLLNARSSSHGMRASLALMVAGGIAGVIAYGLINLYLTGDPLYFMPQVWWATVDAEAARRDIYPEAAWLVVPGVVAVLSLAFAVVAAARRLSRRPLTEGEALAFSAAAAFLLVAGVYSYLTFLGSNNVLEHFFYVTYLLPFAYVVIGMTTALVLPALRPLSRNGTLIAIGAALCLLAPFALAPLRFMPGCPEGCLSSTPLQLLLVASLGLAALVVFTRRAEAGLALLLVYALINVGVADTRVLTFSSTERQAMHQQSSMALETHALVRQHDPNHELRYWVDLSDRYGWVYAAVAGQNLWDRRLVSLEFPKLRSEVELKPGDPMMLASSGNDDPLLRANEALSSQNLRLVISDKARVQRGSDGFDLIFTTVQAKTP